MGLFDWLFSGRRQPRRAQDVDAELAHWRIAEIEGEDGAVVVARIRLRRPDLPDLDRYTTAVSISWPLVDVALSPELTEAMNQFEASMDDFEDFSYLIQVRTGLGERNWLYYTSDRERLAAAIQSQLAAHGWPITLEIGDDPNWAQWRILADRIS